METPKFRIGADVKTRRNRVGTIVRVVRNLRELFAEEEKGERFEELMGEYDNGSQYWYAINYNFPKKKDIFNNTPFHGRAREDDLEIFNGLFTKDILGHNPRAFFYYEKNRRKAVLI